jgi:hypothetical protein
MALFGRGEKPEARVEVETHPIVGKTIYCRICNADRMLTRCWRRVTPVRVCTCCATPFENPRALYAQTQPRCPRCGEPLEYPGFDYGLCDGCGSKFEIMEGTKPSMLPNLKQRQEMEKFGKSRSVL